MVGLEKRGVCITMRRGRRLAENHIAKFGPSMLSRGSSLLVEMICLLRAGGSLCGAFVREADSSVAGTSENGISDAIEKSKKQGWTKVREGASSSGGLDDYAIWEELKAKYPHFFKDNLDVKLGRLIAEGGQAHIYKAMLDGVRRVAKVFKMEGFCLADLKRQWSLVTKTPKVSLFEDNFVLGGVVFGELMMYCSWSYWGTFLEDGRFALVMQRYWGDLRTFIDFK